MACVVSTFAMLFLRLMASSVQFFETDIPRSVPLIDGLLSIAVFSAIRFSPRLAEITLRAPMDGNHSRVLVVGAGSAGQALVRDMRANPDMRLQPLGFLDDDPHKRNVVIHGISVLGSLEELPQIVREHGIDRVIIAMPTAPGAVNREVIRLCEKAQVPAQTLPATSDIIRGRVTVGMLRKVEIEDLLRREPVQTDLDAVRDLIRGKRVLVTGGGGSIGSELCRQILRCTPSELAILGHGENSVFRSYNEMRRLVNQLDAGEETPAVHTYIGDIRFPERIDSVFRQFRPEIVFHAAAHKHVPLMELNPMEAILNNVYGTHNLLKAATANDVQHFVMISTDKAVNPTSIMGASKRIAELLVLRAARQTSRQFVTVRFGNVLGSSGSVVLTFREQIARGGPVTVSHPDMERFFMTIPEAVQLVLQAAVLGGGGEIFVLDMGEPIKIMTLAQDMIQLSGLELGHDIEIEISGVRPGEKLYEELFVFGETYDDTRHHKIRMVHNAVEFVPDDLESLVENVVMAARKEDPLAIRRGITQLIPQYQPDTAPPVAGFPDDAPAELDPAHQ
jgi:FlaA1/EpsC-like NDP-sugar epimerase